MIERKKKILERICPRCRQKYGDMDHMVGVIVSLRRLDWSYRHIAEYMGISHGTVYTYYKKQSIWRRFVILMKSWNII